MSFSADWLSLRASADQRARNQYLQRKLVDMMGDGPHCILDLGSGTGANLNFLAPAISGQQHWRLVDNDPALLRDVRSPNGVSIERCSADLAGDLEALFQPAPSLVTASAFFDLCGIGILHRIVGATAQAGALFYTVLTYDGRERWMPPHKDDEAVLSAFCADQCRDKGLGPATGPNAVQAMRQAFEDAGYTVLVGPSDWKLEAGRDSGLIAALAQGSATAVSQVLGDRADAWGVSRSAATSVLIGHHDLLAWPG